jgi:hypothetical protein
VKSCLRKARNLTTQSDKRRVLGRVSAYLGPFCPNTPFIAPGRLSCLCGWSTPNHFQIRCCKQAVRGAFLGPKRARLRRASLARPAPRVRNGGVTPTQRTQAVRLKGIWRTSKIGDASSLCENRLNCREKPSKPRLLSLFQHQNREFRKPFWGCRRRRRCAYAAASSRAKSMTLGDVLGYADTAAPPLSMSNFRFSNDQI